MNEQLRPAITTTAEELIIQTLDRANCSSCAADDALEKKKRERELPGVFELIHNIRSHKTLS